MTDQLSRRLPLFVNLAHIRQWTGRALLMGFSQKPGTEAPAEGVADNAEGLRRGKGKLIAGVQEIADTSPMIENDDPLRRRIFRRPRQWRWLRALRNWAGYLKPREMTADELAIRDENKRRMELEKLLLDEATLMESRMVTKLAAIGLCKKRMKDGSEYVTDKVSFDAVKMTPQAFYFHVGHYPDGVTVMGLYNDSVCTDLSEAVGHRVRSQFDADKGLLFIVERASTMGVPDFVTFKDMMDRLPQNLGALAFPIGVAANGRHVRRDLVDMPHLLVAGTTGAGKSNMINAMICCWIMRNTPADMQLLLIDLKGGVEFGPYGDIPHLIAIPELGGTAQNGIIETLDDVIPALDWINDEGQRRLAILKKAGYRNVTEYNRKKHPKNRVPRLVVVIDEWANIKLQLGKKAESALTNITNLYRAAGIHVVLATQNPKAEIVNTVITTNFSCRMAFSMPQAASQVVLGNWYAFNLNPKGRMYFQSPDEGLLLQAPRITDSTIRAIVETSKSGGQVKEMTAIDAEELLEWALLNLNGKLDSIQLFTQFKDRITKHGLTDLLRSMDGQTYQVNDAMYIIAPPAGSIARKAELVE
jgi:hypothetical protein